MPEMKTLGGYEIVDAKAREDIETLKNAGHVTEAYVDEAIYNSRDAYYFLVNGMPIGQENAIAATAEMIEFVERFNANHNVCVHIQDASSVTTSGWTTALIGGINSHRILRSADIDILNISKYHSTVYYNYHIDQVNDEWVQYKEPIGQFTITTKEYVDAAIAALKAELTGGA